MDCAKKGISGSTIKIIAIVAMLIDHISAVVITRVLVARGLYEVAMSGNSQQLMEWMSLENALLYMLMFVMRLIGRLGFPIFCFLLVEGFQKTKNIKKYVFRLGIFALISEIPFNLAISGKFFDFGYQNVYFTLLIGILALCAFDFIQKNDVKKLFQVLLTAAGILMLPAYVAIVVRNVLSGLLMAFGVAAVPFVTIYLVLVIPMVIFYIIYRVTQGSDKAWKLFANLATLSLAMFAADNLHTDYAGFGVLTIVAMYLFRKKKVISMLAGCIVLTVTNFIEITAFFCLIPVACYNGKRGLKMKYFFYAFYPAHLLILWLIALAMGMGWIPAV